MEKLQRLHDMTYQEKKLTRKMASYGYGVNKSQQKQSKKVN
jgi:hypothetical protein